MKNNIEKIFLIMKNINKQHHIFKTDELQEEEENINDLLNNLDDVMSQVK